MAQGLVIPIVVQWQRIQLPVQEPQVRSLGQEDPLEKEMQPAPVFLPGKSHGQRSLAGYSYSPWSHTELDTVTIHAQTKAKKKRQISRLVFTNQFYSQ